MKANRLRGFLLFSIAGGVFQSPAQQTEADLKLIGEIRVKVATGDAQSQAELGKVFQIGRAHV